MYKLRQVLKALKEKQNDGVSYINMDKVLEITTEIIEEATILLNSHQDVKDEMTRVHNDNNGIHTRKIPMVEDEVTRRARKLDSMKKYYHLNKKI